MSPAPHIDAERFASTERIFGWIESLAGLGHRKTGTPQGRASAEYIAAQLRSFGLDQVIIEAAPTPCPTVHAQSLSVDGVAYPSYWVNGTGRPADLGRFRAWLEAEIVYIGRGCESDYDSVDVSGKIVLCDVDFHPWTNADILDRNPRGEAFDPDGTLSREFNKFDIYSPNNWPDNFFHAQRRGALGFVGILQNYMDRFNYNEDYTDNGEALGVKRMEIPALWISRSDGAQLAAALNDGRGSASLHLDVEYELKDALNVSATLPGLTPEIVLVHSHHDAVFNGAVQDASGVSEVLALAEYFAGVPLEERAKTLMFTATDTHFTDYIGHLAFLEARDRGGDRIVLDICIEHIAKEVELDSENQAIETGFIEPRLVYISDESGLYSDVKAAFERHRLDRTFFLPVKHDEADPEQAYVFRSDEVVSDAYYFAAAGIPVVSLVCGPMYLFHPSDTLERVAVEQLRPVGLAFAEITAAALAR